MDSLAGERLTALILRKKHRWLKWVLGVLAVVIGLPTLIVLFTVYTPWGQRRMAALAIEALHDELGLNATLERVNIEMFPPKIEAQGILLDVPKYGRFAEANALVIRPSLFAFARGAVDFEEVRLEEPTLNLVVRDGRVVNLPKPRRTGGPSEVPKEIPVKHVVVRGAKLTVDAAPHGTGVLEGVTFTLDTHKGMLVDVDLSAAAGRIEHTKGVESVYGIELKGRAGPDGVDVERFRLASEFVKVDLRDGHVPIPFGSGYQGKAYVRVDLAHANQLPVDVELPHVDGVVEVEGELTGTPEGPVADGVLRIDGVHVEQWGFGTLTLAIHADHEAIEIKNGVGEIVDGGGTVGIKGRLGLGPSLPLTISLDIQNLQFAKLMDQLGVSPNAIVQWTVTGPAKLSGTLNPLILDGPLHIQTKDFLVTNGAWHDANSFRIVGVDSASLRSHVSVRSDALRFLDIDATLPKSKIKGDVLLGFDNALRVTAVVDGLDLADTTPLLDFPIGGVGSARVDVGGTMLAPTLKGHLTAKDFVFNTFPVGNIDTDMLLENHTETVRFPRISVEKNTSRFVVNDLVLDFRDDRFRAGGAADFAALELTDFLHIFHYDADPRFAGMTAHMQGKLAVDYTRGFPGDAPTGTMVAKVDMDADRAAIAGVAFDGGAIDGTWRWTDYARGYEGGTLDVRHASLRKGRGTLSARGSMGLGGALRMTASADRLALTELEPVRQRTTALGGLLGFVANVGGTVAEPRIGADLTLSSLSYGQSLLGDGRFYVRMTDRADPWLADPTRGAGCERARAGLQQADWGSTKGTEGARARAGEAPSAILVCGSALKGTIATDVAIGNAPGRPVRGAVGLEHFDLGPFLRQAAGERSMDGVASGTVSFTAGTLEVPDTVDAHLSLRELEVKRANVSLRARDAVELDVKRGVLRVEQAAFTGPSSELEVRGTASLTEGLALDLEGGVDLRVLATLSPRISHASGRMGLKVSIGGTALDPTVFGKANFTDGEFQYAGFPVPLTDMHGSLSFSARRILLENFEAEMAGGHLALSGEASLRGLALDRYELAIHGSKLTLHPEEGIDVALGGDLTLEWVRGKRLPVLAGKLELNRVVYSRPMQLFQELSIGDLSRDKRASFDLYDPEADRVALDIRLVSAGRIRVLNNVIDADVRIEDSEEPFRIVGTDQRLGALGTLEIPRGSMLFRSSRFEIRRGVVDFADGTRINPSFDVAAFTEVRRSSGFTGPNWRVNLHAHGDLDAFRLDTSSEPALSQEDIILLLTMGMTRAEADQLQAGDVTESAALEALATVTGINREVRRAVPVIDDFRVTSQYSPRTNRTEPQVAVGKRITDSVRLSAATGLSDSRQLKTAVEWRVGDQTALQAAYDNVNASTASSLGNIGVDVRWRLEFQ